MSTADETLCRPHHHTGYPPRCIRCGEHDATGIALVDLRAKLDAAENERENWRDTAMHNHLCWNRAEQERDAAKEERDTALKLAGVNARLVIGIEKQRDAALARVKELEAEVAAQEERYFTHVIEADTEGGAHHQEHHRREEALTAQVRELRETLGKVKNLSRLVWDQAPQAVRRCTEEIEAIAFGALSRTGPKEAPATIRESQAVGPDLGPCPVSGECRGRVHALISEDGSAWEADLCDACGRRWWHDPPKLPHLAKLDTPARASTREATGERREASDGQAGLAPASESTAGENPAAGSVDPRTHEAAMRALKEIADMRTWAGCYRTDEHKTVSAKRLGQCFDIAEEALAAFDAIGGG